MTTDAINGQGLLQAILEEPEADDLRLIYADWLEDHGDPERREPELAAFIRTQCLLATLEIPEDEVFDADESGGICNICDEDVGLESHYHCPRCKAVVSMMGCHRKECVEAAARKSTLLRQENDLMRFNMWKWLRDGLPEPMNDWFSRFNIEGSEVQPRRDEQHSVLFRRGFIHAVSAPLDTLLQHLPALLLRHPVQEVRVTDKRPMDYTTETEPHFTWWEETKILGLVGPEYLPTATWESLDRHVELSDVSLRQFDARDYLTEADALAALGRAVLEVCKKESNIIKLKGVNT